MTDTRQLSTEGVAILEAMLSGAGSRLLSDGVMRALQETGLIERHGNGWIITSEGQRALTEARERMKDDPQISHGNG